jgi:hypothetical protein
VTYEAFDAMKGCDFDSPVIMTIAAAHHVQVGAPRVGAVKIINRKIHDIVCCM